MKLLEALKHTITKQLFNPSISFDARVFLYCGADASCDQSELILAKDGHKRERLVTEAS